MYFAIACKKQPAAGNNARADETIGQAEGDNCAEKMKAYVLKYADHPEGAEWRYATDLRHPANGCNVVYMLWAGGKWTGYSVQWGERTKEEGNSAKSKSGQPAG